MKNAQFNFHYEDTLIDIIINDDDTVTVLGTTFDDIQSFAEKFAVQRGVPSDSLKSWHIIRQGDIYNYVPKAATAGNGDDIGAIVNRLLLEGVSTDKVAAAIEVLRNKSLPQTQPGVAENVPETPAPKTPDDYIDDLFEYTVEDIAQDNGIPAIWVAAAHFSGKDVICQQYDNIIDSYDGDYEEECDDVLDIVIDAVRVNYENVQKALTQAYPGIPIDVSLALLTEGLDHPWLSFVSKDELRRCKVVAQITNRPLLVYRNNNGSIESFQAEQFSVVDGLRLRSTKGDVLLLEP